MTQQRFSPAFVADRIFDLLHETIRRVDEVIPAKQVGGDEETALTGIHHILRHYEHLLARIVEDPEEVSLEEYSEEEARDLAFYAARTGNVEALALILRHTGIDPAVRDERGLTMLDYAQRERQYAVAHHLIGLGVGKEETCAA